MNKKDIITIIITTLVIAALIVGCFVLSKTHRKTSENKKILGIVLDNVKDNCAYMSLRSSDSLSSTSLVKFDLETETVEKLCRNEDCYGLCPLCNSPVIFRIYLNKIYFMFRGSPQGFAYYDITTGETKVIKEYDYLNTRSFFYNGYIYHMLDAVNTDEPKVYRLSQNGKEKTFLRLEKHEKLIMVADGMIITNKTVSGSDPLSEEAYSIIYSYNIDTLKRRELWRSNRDGVNAVLSCNYYNGKLYFTCGSTTNFNTSDQKNSLYCLDIFSGEATKVSDNCTSSFSLNKEGLYYLTKSPREIVVPGGNTYLIYDFAVWKADLFGNNSEDFFKFSDTIYSSSYTVRVHNGKIFGNISRPTLIGERYNIYVADVQSGEIRIIDIPK